MKENEMEILKRNKESFIPVVYRKTESQLSNR